MGLIAEHGAWIREPGSTGSGPRSAASEAAGWELIKPLSHSWKAQLLPRLRLYADRVPGSFVEEKEFSLAWHYRKADPELGAYRAKELIDDLVQFTANFDVQILEGKKVVEIRNSGVNKGMAALHCQKLYRPEFFLAIGDDQTDEDLFKAMPDDSYTIRVGLSISYADYCLQNYQEVQTAPGHHGHGKCRRFPSRRPRPERGLRRPRMRPVLDIKAWPRPYPWFRRRTAPVSARAVSALAVVSTAGLGFCLVTLIWIFWKPGDYRVHDPRSRIAEPRYAAPPANPVRFQFDPGRNGYAFHPSVSVAWSAARGTSTRIWKWPWPSFTPKVAGSTMRFSAFISTRNGLSTLDPSSKLPK